MDSKCLLDAQSLDGIDRCGALCGDDACDGSRKDEDADSYGHDRNIDAGNFIELRLDVAHTEDGDRYPDRETDYGLQHGSAHDGAYDAATRGSERHADTDLGGAPDDRIGGDAVKADCREEKGEK